MRAILQLSLSEEPFDCWELVAEFEQQHLSGQLEVGACSAFSGKMRDANEGDCVTGMYLEHYAGMTEKVIRRQVDEVLRDYPVNACLIRHRIGHIEPGETIVVCAVWAAHRQQSFRACETIFEALKSTAPFWKKETLADGSDRWVESNTPNPQARGPE